MARIVIDGRMLSWTGIGRYTRELIENLQVLDSKNEYHVLVLGRDWESWEPHAPNFHKVQSFSPFYSLSEQTKLPTELSRLDPDLVHFCAPNIPLVYRGRSVTTIHDLTLLEYKNIDGNPLVYEAKFRAFQQVMRRAARHSVKVITPTEFVKKQIVDRYHRKPSDVIFTWLAPENSNVNPADASKRPLQEPPYIFYVGNYYPYKNIGRLIEAMPAIRRDHPDIRLVLAGSQKFQEPLRELVRQLKLQEAVTFVGRVSDDELANLYQYAKLFALPSLSEGFGMQLLESMFYGVPVTSSNASCLPEVAGDAAVYFNPHDSQDIARVISKTLSDDQLLQKLGVAGKARVKEFSWRRTAEQTLAVYREALRSD